MCKVLNGNGVMALRAVKVLGFGGASCSSSTSCTFQPCLMINTKSRYEPVTEWVREHIVSSGRLVCSMCSTGVFVGWLPPLGGLGPDVEDTMALKS